MKKILLFSSIIIGGALNAQITLTQANHAPASADTYSTKAVTTTTVSPGAAGSGVTWNLSAITIGSVVTAYTATNSTNMAYNPANIVVNDNASQSSYYQSTPSNLNYFGGNIILLTGFPTTITYTSAANYATYPMSFGTNSTSAVIGGSLIVGGSNGTFTGNSKNIADATGTLVLPSITYTNVLRVLVTQTINFAVPGFGVSAGVLNQDTYNYFIPSRKSPILTIVTSTVVAPPVFVTPTTQTVTTIASDYLVTGLTENQSTLSDLSVFPNPSNNYINFTTQNNNAISIEVYDLTGKKLETRNFNNGKVSFETSYLAPGIYIYSIKDATKQTLTNGKFSVIH
jgi:hypothetical protein